MEADLQNSEGHRIGLVALLAALLLAANEVAQGGILGLFGSYLYWVVRISIESALFVATLYALEKFVPPSSPRLMVYAASILISLFPFALAITSLDLIVGLPELGLNDSHDTPTNRLQAFGLELIYLLDNHLLLCTLLLLPELLSLTNAGATDGSDIPTEIGQTRLFHEAVDPPLKGHICRVEAQEHYIRITTTSEKRMVLYRFSDAVRELPGNLGMQVHRSHWVAYTAVKELVAEGQKLQLKLTDGDFVPVSRSFHDQVERRFPVPRNESAEA